LIQIDDYLLPTFCQDVQNFFELYTYWAQLSICLPDIGLLSKQSINYDFGINNNGNKFGPFFMKNVQNLYQKYPLLETIHQNKNDTHNNNNSNEKNNTSIQNNNTFLTFLKTNNITNNLTIFTQNPIYISPTLCILPDRDLSTIDINQTQHDEQSPKNPSNIHKTLQECLQTDFITQSHSIIIQFPLRQSALSSLATVLATPVIPMKINASLNQGLSLVQTTVNTITTFVSSNEFNFSSNNNNNNNFSSFLGM